MQLRAFTVAARGTGRASRAGMLRLACAALLLAACVDPAPVETTAPAPLVGVDGSHDQADRNCNVVLRELLPDHGPVPTLPGTIEISQAAAAESLTPTLMYKDASHPAWSIVEATPEPSSSWLLSAPISQRPSRRTNVMSRLLQIAVVVVPRSFSCSTTTGCGVGSPPPTAAGTSSSLVSEV